MKQQLINGSATLFITLILFGTLGGCKKEKNKSAPVVFSANGDINPTLTEFRNLLGNLNSATGMTSGRREINWDGVPDSLDGKKLPGDFFNPVGTDAQLSLQRGIIYAGDDSAMVSRTGFSEVNANASSSFASFSGNKSFAVINSTLWPVTFEISGERTAASVSGFGAVFSDVDKPNSTFIEYFNGSTSLGRFYVPVHDNATSFSFLAVYFPHTAVTEILIGHEGMLRDGENDITQGGSKDLVVLDDFIYSEPLVR